MRKKFLGVFGLLVILWMAIPMAVAAAPVQVPAQQCGDGRYIDGSTYEWPNCSISRMDSNGVWGAASSAPVIQVPVNTGFGACRWDGAHMWIRDNSRGFDVLAVGGQCGIAVEKAPEAAAEPLKNPFVAYTDIEYNNTGCRRTPTCLWNTCGCLAGLDCGTTANTCVRMLCQFRDPGYPLAAKWCAY